MDSECAKEIWLLNYWIGYYNQSLEKLKKLEKILSYIVRKKHKGILVSQVIFIDEHR